MEGQHPSPIDPKYIDVQDYDIEQYAFQDLATLLWAKDYLSINWTSS